MPVVLCLLSADRMISAWDTFFEVDDYYTYKKPVGHGAYGVVISALDTRDNSKVRASAMLSISSSRTPTVAIDGGMGSGQVVVTFIL